MENKPPSFEKDLDEFRAKYPNVWIDTVSPEDVDGYSDETLPSDWNDPFYQEVKDYISANFDSEFGLSIEDIKEAIDHARKQSGSDSSI